MIRFSEICNVYRRNNFQSYFKLIYHEAPEYSEPSPLFAKSGDMIRHLADYVVGPNLKPIYTALFDSYYLMLFINERASLR